MRIGLVSERRRKRGGLFEVFDRRLAAEEFETGDGFCTVEAVSLPQTAERLGNMKPQKAAAAVLRAADMLRRRGIEKIVFSEETAKYTKEKRSGGREIFYRFVPECVKTVAPRCGICLHRASVGIADGDSGRISEYLIRGLYRDVRGIRLYTQSGARAEELCARVLDETGMPAAYTLGQGGIRREDIFIDAENSTVRIGRDIVVDGIELDLDLRGYSADTLDVAACVNDDRMLKMVKAYICGKNKLTL